MGLIRWTLARNRRRLDLVDLENPLAPAVLSDLEDLLTPRVLAYLEDLLAPEVLAYLEDLLAPWVLAAPFECSPCDNHY